MTWTSFTGTNANGSQQYIDAIEAQLTAHPAWEFVEQVLEYYDQEVTGGTYHAETFTIRIWKNLGTLNRLGQDFYIALIRITAFAPTGTDPLVGFASDKGYVGVVGFEQWDADLKKMIRPVGLDLSFDNPDYTLDPTTKSIRGDLAFPFFQSQVSDDGLSWGSWGSWPKPIASVPANLNNNSYNTVSGYALLYGAYNYEDPAQTDSEGTTTLWMRVTNDGLLTLAYEDYVFYTSYAQGYVGLGDDSARPEELQNPFPLVCTFNLGQGDNTGVVSQSRYPEASATITLIDRIRSDMGVYDSGLAPADLTTSRAGWPYPHLTPYVFVHSCIQSYSPAHAPKDDGIIYYDPGIRIPGLYSASARGGGQFQQFDTILSPEGHTCVIAASAYIGSEGTSSDWVAIDTELD